MAPLLLALGLSLTAAYPTPAEAGFHHCALIYEAAQRGPDELRYYVADSSPAWLFDSFLFLVQSGPSGDPFYGPTQLDDWRWSLDQWFAPDHDLAALDQAVAAAATRLGPPPEKRRIILSIPLPHPGVKNFGDLAGSGVREDLSQPASRDKVLAWFIDEARDRFVAAGYQHLELWGFYWYHEAISDRDQPTVRAAANQLHERGLKFLWIPWYRATGAEQWRDFGFDVALMQPNYAFFSEHRGRLRPNRLTVAAEVAKRAGLGVEIELPMLANNPVSQWYFERYLATGATAREGYQDAATAYYLGTSNVELYGRSKLDWQQQTYQRLCAYVRNQAVPDPDQHPRWQVDGRDAPELSDLALTGGQALGVATAALPRPMPVNAVDLYFDEPDPGSAWSGSAVVEIADEQGRWHSGGWALRVSASSRDERWQVLSIPVRQTAAALRVRLDSGSAAPRVAELSVDTSPPEAVATHLAVGRSYEADPAPTAQYGDRGKELTDGVIPPHGFSSGDTVGWSGGQVAVLFDLGRAQPVDTVEVHLEGGGYAAVNWPGQVLLTTATEAQPPATTNAVGALPAGFGWFSPEPLAIDQQRAPDAANGHYTFRLEPARPARFVNLVCEAQSWLMLGEVRILYGGNNLAPGATYHVRPRPKGKGERYPDDGARLTDGEISQSFVPGLLTGWSDGQPHTFTIDLGAVQPLTAVAVWSLGGGGAGIYAPSEVAVETSVEGQVWSPSGTAPRPDLDEPGTACQPVCYRVSSPIRARYVRVRVTPRQVWTMLSEIEVR